MNILMVDDDIQSVKGVSDIMNWNKIGLELPVSAYSYNQAIQVFQKQQIDLLLCDHWHIFLPSLNRLSDAHRANIAKNNKGQAIAERCVLRRIEMDQNELRRTKADDGCTKEDIRGEQTLQLVIDEGRTWTTEARGSVLRRLK